MVEIHSTVEKTSKKNARHYSRDYFILFQVTVFLTSFPSCVFSIAEFYNFFPSRFGYGLFQLKRSGNSQKKIRPGNCRSQEALGCDIILYPAWKSTREYQALLREERECSLCIWEGDLIEKIHHSSRLDVRIKKNEPLPLLILAAKCQR